MMLSPFGAYVMCIFKYQTSGPDLWYFNFCDISFLYYKVEDEAGKQVSTLYLQARIDAWIVTSEDKAARKNGIMRRGMQQDLSAHVMPKFNE